MKFHYYDYKVVVLLLFVIFIQISLQYHDIPDLPWKKMNLNQKNSGVEKNGDKLGDMPTVTFYNANLQKDSIYGFVEQWENVSKLCHQVAEKFSHVSAQLISCFVQNARPLTVCENCVEEYISFSDIHKKICISTDDKEMQECQSQLLNKDKLNVIQKTCIFVSSLWTDGFCENCFEKENGSLSTTLNNDTKNFLKDYESVAKCFQHATLEVHSAITKNESVCNLCRHVYDSLHKDYSHLQEKSSHSVCIDLTDIMNTTRGLWSGDYHCVLIINSSDIYIYILATVFCILVALFYFGFRFIAHAQNTRIIGQKRFAFKHESNSGSGHQMNSLQ